MASREMSKSMMRTTYSGIGTRDETDSGYQVRSSEDVFHQQVKHSVMNGILNSFLLKSSVGVASYQYSMINNL